MLLEVTREQKPSHVVHRQMLEKYQYLEKQERSFLSRLFKGTLERLITLDYVIGCFSTVKPAKLKPVIKNDFAFIVLSAHVYAPCACQCHLQ